VNLVQVIQVMHLTTRGFFFLPFVDIFSSLMPMSDDSLSHAHLLQLLPLVAKHLGTIQTIDLTIKVSSLPFILASPLFSILCFSLNFNCPKILFLLALHVMPKPSTLHLLVYSRRTKPQLLFSSSYSAYIIYKSKVSLTLSPSSSSSLLLLSCLCVSVWLSNKWRKEEKSKKNRENKEGENSGRCTPLFLGQLEYKRRKKAKEKNKEERDKREN
jgi:hypothetical protein